MFVGLAKSNFASTHPYPMWQDAHSWRLGPMAMQELFTISVKLISIRCSYPFSVGEYPLQFQWAVLKRSCPTFGWQLRQVCVTSCGLGVFLKVTRVEWSGVQG